MQNLRKSNEEEESSANMFKNQNKALEMTLITPSLERISSNNTFKFMSYEHMKRSSKEKYLKEEVEEEA